MANDGDDILDTCRSLGCKLILDICLSRDVYLTFRTGSKDRIAQFRQDKPGQPNVIATGLDSAARDIAYIS